MKTPVNPNELTLDDLKTLIPARPYASVKLPSLGLYYDQSVVKDGCVELCPLSAREQKLIAGIRGHNVDDIIDTILSRCMKTEIDPDDLLVTDRFYLLLMLRSNSYGEDYNFELTCGSCSGIGHYSVKIPSDFEVVTSNPADSYPFTITLPNSKLNITFRLLTGRDQKEIKLAAEKDEKKGVAGQGDPTYIYGIAKSILTVNGKKPNLLVALQLVERMSALDVNFLQEKIEEKTPGIIPVINKKCQKCGKDIETGLPISAEFFRPKFRGEEKSPRNAILPSISG